jgi:hypothetical protein
MSSQSTLFCNKPPVIRTTNITPRMVKDMAMVGKAMDKNMTTRLIQDEGAISSERILWKTKKWIAAYLRASKSSGEMDWFK